MDLVLTPWRKYGHDRTYLATVDGEKLGHVDNKTGALVLLDESRRLEVEAALGRGPAAAPPARNVLPASQLGPVERHNGVSTAGGSARAEYERRVARREQRVRQAHPKLGGLILALSNEPQSTRAWASGAVGEARVGAKLDGLAGDGVLVLHDRRIPGTRANLDHLAIGAAGVFVIDAKRYNDATLEIRRSGGLFSPVNERLFVGGRDKTSLVANMAPQAAAVYEALDGAGFEQVPVQPVLTFVDAVFPLFGSLELAGVPILGTRGTAKLVRRQGPLDLETRQRLHTHLSAALPPYGG